MEEYKVKIIIIVAVCLLMWVIIKWLVQPILRTRFKIQKGTGFMNNHPVVLSDTIVDIKQSGTIACYRGETKFYDYNQLVPKEAIILYKIEVNNDKN